MVFNNILEEVNLFSYPDDMTLEQAREIRYLIGNVAALEDGEVKKMSLENTPKYIYANGVFKGEKCNKTFESFIYKGNHGYKMCTIVTEISSHKNYYSIDEFIYQIKNIKVNSHVEGMKPISRKISYPEEDFTRK